MTHSNAVVTQPDVVNGGFTVGLRIGDREISICRDYRKRYYTPNPIIEWRTGHASGYLELLFLRIWLIRLCAAR